MSEPNVIGGEARLPRSFRVTKRFEYRRVQREASKFHSPHFLFLVAEQRPALLRARIGLTVTKRVGCAVERNRVRRLLREVFRHHKASFPMNYDIVVIAKDGAPKLTFAEVENELSIATATMHRKLGTSRRA